MKTCNCAFERRYPYPDQIACPVHDSGESSGAKLVGAFIAVVLIVGCLAGCSVAFRASLLAPINREQVDRTETTAQEPKPLPTPPPAATPSPTPTPEAK